LPHWVLYYADLLVTRLTPSLLGINLLYIAIGAVILVAGLSSFILWWLRSRERLLLWLGTFSVLFALWLLIYNIVFPIATGLSNASTQFIHDVITYVILIPFVLFFRELIGPGWKHSLTIWFWFQVAFAPLAVVLGIIAGYSHLTDTWNGYLVITGASIILLHLLFGHPVEGSSTVLKYSLLFLLAVILLSNFKLRPHNIDIEPFGFLVLIFGLSYSAALRAFEKEEKLRSVEQELETARRIQSSILPRCLPEEGQIRIGVRYQPMTAVAGDFYDFVQMDDRRITILIADVSGHGIPAALTASMLKIAFGAQRDHAHDPSRVLAGLNRSLTGVLEGQFVTAACAHIDLDSKCITYSAAGHPPALLFRNQTRLVEELCENGLFLGPFPHAQYVNLSQPFDPGDKLLLYTDGILEATGPDGEQFGLDRLKQFLSAHTASEPSLLANEVVQTVAGPAQEDDLTVVVVRALKT
jgi:phosphoserine phosphatase RsbU/P